jgi:hypothetical protein
MTDVSGKFFSAKKVRTGVSPSSPGVQVGETLPPVNPPGTSLNSVGLTMPSAFAVANSPLTSNGTLEVTGAGTVAQYVRGDGSLADFPESSGGGSSVSYYLNGSVSQGTIGGVAYLEMNKVPILGVGTDFTRNSNGYIASFITDAGDPNLLEIPGGNWNFESYFSASSGGGSPTFYVELYKVNASGTATLIASSSANPELISFGTTIAPYFSSLAVPTTTLALTDRLAVRYYVTPAGRTLTLHTEGPHLCQIITTFTTGLTSLNGLNAQVQFFAVGTSGTDFNIASATATHTFNLPTASSTNRGALSSADWSTFNNKQNALTNPVTGTGTSGQVAYWSSGSAITGESNLFWDATNDRLGIGNLAPNAPLTVQSNAGGVSVNLIGRNNAGTDESTILFTDFDSITRNAIIQGTNSGLTFFYGPSTTFGMRLDGSGNLGIGVTPSAWSILVPAIQIGDRGGYVAAQNGTNVLRFGSNNYFNGSNFIYTTTDRASYFETGSGEYKWFQAPSGTAGTSILFTQAMILDSNGRLGIGTLNPSTTLDVNGAGTFIGNLTSSSFIKSGGTSSQFLKADGSIDSTSYVPVGRTITINGTTQDLSANRTFNVGTVTAVTASSPLASSGGATPNITIQQASGSQNGFLSSTDWTTFNNKVSGTGTSGQIAYFTGTSAISSESNLFWDATNDRLGIGNLAPNAPLTVQSNAGGVSVNLIGRNNAGTDESTILFTDFDSITRNAIIQGTNSGLTFFYGSSTTLGMRLDGSGNLGIGVTPSAWSVLVPAIQIGDRGGYIAAQNGDNILRIGSNNYFNGSNFIYTTTGTASFFEIGNGEYKWFQAPSGTAGNAITFSQPMTITSGGNVLIGTTTDNGSRLRINGSIALPHVTKSANYTLDGTDYTVGFDCASNRTANLPDATTCAGRIYVIYQYNTNNGARYVTLDGNGSQTINGMTTYSLYPYCENTTITIQSNGANWIIIASNLTVDCM